VDLQETKSGEFLAGSKLSFADVAVFVALSNMISGFMDGKFISFSHYKSLVHIVFALSFSFVRRFLYEKGAPHYRFRRKPKALWAGRTHMCVFWDNIVRI
jgi:glutathione S-transferase